MNIEESTLARFPLFAIVTTVTEFCLLRNISSKQLNLQMFYLLELFAKQMIVKEGRGWVGASVNILYFLHQVKEGGTAVCIQFYFRHVFVIPWGY